MALTDPVDSTSPEPDFSVDLPPVADPADAEWRLRRLRRLQRLRAETKETYDRLVAETKEWYDSETAHVDAEIAEIERQLAGWLDARIALDPKGPKSVSLPTGKISSSKGSLSVEVTDEDAFMKWARKNNVDLIAVPAPPPPPPPRPDKNEIKALGGDTDEPGQHSITVGEGDEREIIPGVHLVRAERTIKVDFREQG